MQTETQQGDLRTDHTTHALKLLLNLTIDNNFSAALWRLPNQETLHMTVDTEGYKALSDIDLEELPQGFIFCPFDEGEKVFIRSHLHFAQNPEQLEFTGAVDENIRRSVENIFDPDADPDKTSTQNSRYFISSLDTGSTVTDKGQYLDIVRSSIEFIRRGDFEKVVPSRTRELTLSENFDVVENFLKLTNAYPRAFVFFVSIPGIGSWMGATPETLIEIENSITFRTVSLAGTQNYFKGTIPEEVAWTQKDIEEQAMVSRYIINCFKKIRLREFIEYGPKTVIAGNLMHLKTVYEVNLQDTGFYNLGTTMLKLLHPTSAVCGMPKETARKFLDANEKHHRHYYSGFLGPVDNSKDTHIFVNLRCMELSRNKAVLYAGSGITEDSIPEREWLETEMKCNTLLNVIGN